MFEKKLTNEELQQLFIELAGMTWQERKEWDAKHPYPTYKELMDEDEENADFDLADFEDME
jgi:hypothetical protein